ncbi:hypothetical protein SPRG_14120 [Saprolegnia parasitica CBS 223.65]|uniref:F-box domain-containing protein n=1 Tax=Saprolegnia parasitica (strain CBS 223.65) TaxID=695850 RepID=A0A067BQV2_SAPPC|nr:hypothetical protein SPRG_14120 [Saprolegnia parasitica CBS 223.65]KDO20889.1 hypothetical protein SPRG_14120 [Saprolegnia parasitica CBS 223.65]|eukprot:XP_012208378.1 hypothetical protein SPRG_14120 [Saprolegnia parasitica CBS 223.65]
MLPQDLVHVVARYVEAPDDVLSFLDALPAGSRGPSLGSLVALATERPASALWPRLVLSSVASNRQRKWLCNAMRNHPCVELDADALGLWVPHILPSTRLRMSIEKSHVDALPDSILSALCELEIMLDTPTSISVFACFLQTLPRLRVLRLECLWTSLDSPPRLEPLIAGPRQVWLESVGFSFQRGHVLSIATVTAIAQFLSAQSVRDVSFRSVDVTPEAGDTLSAVLESSQSLQRLVLQESHTLVAALTRTTRHLPHLKHLVLNDVSWRHLETLWSRLPACMKGLSTLHLWLDHGRLNDDEFKRFVSVLGQLQLETLQLHAKNLLLNYPGRVALLLAALAPQRDLVALTLHFTMLSNDDIWTLAATLPCAVATLDLRYNAYNDASVDALLVLLQRPALRHVALAETLSHAAQDRLRATCPRPLRLTFDAK